MYAPVDDNTQGFMHDHLDDYETGDTNADGDPVIRQPIRIFSPADVDKFMQILDRNKNDGNNFSQYYSTLVTSTGTYTLKFSGAASEIKTGFQGPTWGGKFIHYFAKAKGNNDMSKFLRFVRDEMKITGLELYEIKKGGILANRVQLNPDNENRVTSTPCAGGVS
ncbi:MAG: hypothetical protein J7539_09030 [Niabella sp.]|nr:hypothetical protein [Niabella sp.]